MEAIKKSENEDASVSFDVHFNLISLTLKHVHYDTFEAASPFGPWTRLTFLNDEDGCISAVRLPAEVNVPPMIFNRAANPVSPALLEKYAGSYKLDSGQEVLLILSPTGKLSIQLPGQPPLALETVNQTTFQTITYPRITATCFKSADGETQSIEILHPNGLFLATRN